MAPSPVASSLSGSGRASRTARAVAAGRAIGYRHLHDPLAHRFLPPTERAVVKRARAVASRRMGADALAVTTGGLSRHAALRMFAMDQVVEKAMAGGVRQVVVVGAGFDTRAWRVPSIRECTVWELDLPGTQQAKRSGLGGRGQAAHVRFVEADLARESLPAVMAATDHDPTAPTVWVWEAVAPYLPPEAVTATLSGIVEQSAGGSRLGMTFANPSAMGLRVLAPVTGTLANYGFQAMGEPILSTYDSWEICQVVEAAGFHDPVVTDADAWARAAECSARPDPLRAEMLLTAQV
ncbi:class I SAM-dependent methyltransferase [Euzebya tangerina]|uniref:class I SAM-dependent methyltransferase n=1 Tax=Euzebya tangerina TaxID=591198 RepID=UPI0013C33C58|nr:SAM-dependent methyltransferase [Euzebya tangerina]